MKNSGRNQTLWISPYMKETFFLDLLERKTEQELLE
uniref:Uncharacterized protein n=1 Tax=Arundo donax TaxID=35708 RepID=A0A0A8ZYZ0_ARUDO